jgi:hypothetical protein
MLTNAAKFDVDEKSFVLEVQQLGLPKENTDAIAKQYRDAKDMLRNKFADDSYRVSKLLNVDWRMDHIIASSKPTLDDERVVQLGPLVHLNLTVDAKPHLEDNTMAPSLAKDAERFKNIAFEISPQKLDVLIHELSHAQSLLQNMDA